MKGDEYFGVLAQYPSTTGLIHDMRALVRQAHDNGALFCVATDLLALTLLEAPGTWDADIVVGNSQRFGVPFGFGGPHAGFLRARMRSSARCRAGWWECRSIRRASPRIG